MYPVARLLLVSAPVVFSLAISRPSCSLKLFILVFIEEIFVSNDVEISVYGTSFMQQLV